MRLYAGMGFFEDYQTSIWRWLNENELAYADLLERWERRVIPATGRTPVFEKAGHIGNTCSEA